MEETEPLFQVLILLKSSKYTLQGQDGIVQLGQVSFWHVQLKFHHLQLNRYLQKVTGWCPKVK